MHSESVDTQNLSFSNSEARGNANLPTPSKPAASPTPPPPPRRPPPDLRRRTRALFLRASDVSRSHSPRCRPGSLHRQERGRWQRPRLHACDLICKSFAEAPTPSATAGEATKLRAPARDPARRSAPSRGRAPAALSSPCRRRGPTVRQSGTCDPLPQLRCGSGAVTPRCCSRRTGLRSSPSGGPDAWVET